MLRLIIKGDTVSAKVHALSHGVAIAEQHENHWNQTNYALVETIALADDAFTDRVVKWFLEPNDGAPYPVGTLLWYSDVGPDNRRSI